MEKEQQDLRKARFTASRMSELLTGGTGKTAQNYILDLALQALDLREDFQSKEMLHGANNQINAFQFVVKPQYPDSRWWDEYIEINPLCGASPDFFIGDCPGDIKCPYYIDNFIQQIISPPKKYLIQVQTQILAAKSDFGFICFYLTKPEIWGEDEWLEYPFPLEKRHRMFEIAKDNEIQEQILSAVERAEPLKQSLILLLQGATILEEDNYFNQCFEGVKYRALKEANSIYNLKEVFRVGDKFYYLAR